METKKRIKLDIKSNSGFTMTDLIVALGIFTIFTGIIGTLLYSATKTNLQTKLSETGVNYAIQILEDIDKKTFDQVQNGMEASYMSSLSIPSSYQLSIQVGSSSGSKKDVKLTLTYTLLGKTEKIVIERTKIKEG